MSIRKIQNLRWNQSCRFNQKIVVNPNLVPLTISFKRSVYQVGFPVLGAFICKPDWNEKPSVSLRRFHISMINTAVCLLAQILPREGVNSTEETLPAFRNGRRESAARRRLSWGSLESRGSLGSPSAAGGPAV